MATVTNIGNVSALGYPKYVRSQIKLLELNRNDPDRLRVIGSYSYRNTLYSGDIDLFEEVHMPNITHLIKFFKRSLQRVVKQIVSNNQMLFNEVKLGIDERYEFEIGECHSNVFTPSETLVPMFDGLVRTKLITPAEHRELVALHDTTPLTQLEYEKISELLRKHYVIRWTSDEIAEGVKQLPLGKMMTIESAAAYLENINIEVVSIVGNRYVDMSNFFVLTFEENGETVALNINDMAYQNFTDFRLSGLKLSLYKLVYSKIQQNLYKALKRYYSIAKLSDDTAMLGKVLPILNSRIGFTGSLLSECKLLYSILDKHGIPPYIQLYKNQLQRFKFDLQKTTVFDDDELSDINTAIDDNDDSIFSVDKYMELLKYIVGRLFGWLQHTCMGLMRSNQLYPIPPSYVPATVPF